MSKNDKIEEKKVTCPFESVTAEDIINLGHETVPTLLDPIFPKQGVVLLGGEGDVGKSYFLLQFMDAIVNGDEKFLGYKLDLKHKKAIYVSTEDGKYDLSPRLKNLQRIREGKDTKVYANLRVILQTEKLISQLDYFLKQGPVDLIVLDTFSDLFSGDINQSSIVRSFIQKYKELADKHETLICFNHHSNKSSAFRMPSKDNFNGSQGIVSKVRLVIEMRKDPIDPSYRHLCIVKANNLGEQFKDRSYKLRFSLETGFKNTGERTPFDQIVCKQINGVISKNPYEGAVRELLLKGVSHRKVVAQINGGEGRECITRYFVEKIAGQMNLSEKESIKDSDSQTANKEDTEVEEDSSKAA